MRYVLATSVAHAVSEVGAGAVPIAGGTVLVPLIAHGMIDPPVVVDVGRLAELREVTTDGDAVSVGAAVRLRELASGEDFGPGEQALVEAAGAVGNPLVRRGGTVGGNVAAGLPPLDLPPALLVLEGEAVLATIHGEDVRSVADVLASGVPSGTLLSHLRIPKRAGRRSGFVKFARRRATGTAVVNVAVALDVDGGIVSRARIAVGGWGQHAVRLPGAEAMVERESRAPNLAGEVGGVAAEEAPADEAPDVTDAFRSYRRGLVRLGVRSLLESLAS